MTGGGPQAAPRRTAEALWHADGEMVRSAYTLRRDDDDWGQPGTLVRDVIDDAARDRLVSNIVGHLLDGVSEPVLVRAFVYWRKVDEHRGASRQRRVAAPHACQRAREAGRLPVCLAARPSCTAGGVARPAIMPPPW